MHPLDPVSYRMEPLLAGAYSSSTSGVLPDHHALRHSGASKIMMAVNECTGGRVDVEIKPKIR